MMQLFSALTSFYIASDDFPFTIHIRIDLDDPIDTALLRHSLDLAQSRYPYLSVQVEVVDGQYVLESNPRPFALFDSPIGVVLGSAEANGHLIALAADDCSISFLAFHGLVDGRGFFPFMKTVLYLYLSEKTGEQLEVGAVRLPGQVPFAPEFVDPYPATVPDSIEPFGLYRPDNPFFLPEGAANSSHSLFAYRVSLPENAFMKYTRESDGSPATMVAAFMFKSIQKLHPENAKTLSCGMAFDRRGVLQTPDTFWNTASVIHLGYKPDMVELPMTTLATISRGMVFLQSQPENTLVDIRKMLASRHGLLALGHKERKVAIAKAFSSNVNTDTYNVSYVGRANFGDLERFIVDFSIYTNIAGTGVLVELTALNGQFLLTFLQDFEDDCYVREFCQLLAEEGIETTRTESSSVTIPGICLP